MSFVQEAFDPQAAATSSAADAPPHPVHPRPMLSLERRLLDAVVAAENRRLRALHLVAADGVGAFTRALDRLRDASRAGGEAVRARVLLPLDSDAADPALHRTMFMAAFDVRAHGRQLSVIGVDPRASASRVDAFCVQVGSALRRAGLGSRFLMLPCRPEHPRPSPPLSGLDVALAMHEHADFFAQLHDDLPTHYLDAIRIDCTLPLRAGERALLLAMNTTTWRRLRRDLPPDLQPRGGARDALDAQRLSDPNARS